MLIRLKSEKCEGLFAAWEEDGKDTFQFAYKNAVGWTTMAVEPGLDSFEISDAGMEHLIGFVDELGTHYSQKEE